MAAYIIKGDKESDDVEILNSLLINHNKNDKITQTI